MTAGSDGFARAISVLAVASATLLSTVPASLAATQLCQQLEARLTRASAPAPRNATKYDSAIARQREQIVRVRNRSQIAGCGLAALNRGIEDCDRLTANLADMERNLAMLQRKRDALLAVRSTDSPDQILAALDANGCRQPAEPQLNVTDDSIPAAQPVGEAMEPGIEQDTASVSDVRPETSATSFEVLAGNPPAAEAPLMEADPTKSSSIVRPQTVSAPAGPQSSASAVEAGSSADLPEHDLDPNRRVRVVGPTFLPDPEEAIDLRAPGRNRAR